jgi:hypothetical protein
MTAVKPNSRGSTKGLNITRKIDKIKCYALRGNTILVRSRQVPSISVALKTGSRFLHLSTHLFHLVHGPLIAPFLSYLPFPSPSSDSALAVARITPGVSLSLVPIHRGPAYLTTFADLATLAGSIPSAYRPPSPIHNTQSKDQSVVRLSSARDV